MSTSLLLAAMVRARVLQCVAVCCSVLQCGAVWAFRALDEYFIAVSHYGKCTCVAM